MPRTVCIKFRLIIYLTVAIGCTGGQHRSVYMTQWLAERFRNEARVLLRHRSLASSGK